MENDIKIRKVTQDVILFVWFKNKVITKEPSHTPGGHLMPGISADFLNILSISIWMESLNEEERWKIFLSNHFKRMTSSSHLFAHYVAFCCIYGTEKVPDAFQSFYNALSIVSYFGLYCWERECKNFINACVELFCAFFEKRLRTNFERQGGWKNFSENLEYNNYQVRKCRSLISENKSLDESYNSLREKIRQGYELINLSKDPTIGNINRRRIEIHRGTVSFVKSVAYKVSELCKKKLDEILTDFAMTDHQVKELNQQTVEKVSKGISLENVLVQKLQKALSQPGTSRRKRVVKDLQKQTDKSFDTIEIQNFDNIHPQDVDASDKAVHKDPKSRRSERIRNMVDDISMDLAKLSSIIKSLCQEHGVEISEWEEAESKV